MTLQYRPTRRQLLKHSAAASALAMAGMHSPAFLSVVGAQIARDEAFYISGHQWGPPVTYNPMAATIAFPCAGGQWAYIYQPLFTFNLLTGDVDPSLGETMEFDGTESVTVKLFDGTTWHDGTPLTADDVVYTYTVPERFPGVPFAASRNYISSVEAVDDRTIKFGINQDGINLGMVRTALSNTSIMPKHIWEPREAEEDDLLAFEELDPVGSGPFKVSIANPEQVVVERVDDYWGNDVHGAPAPKFVVHPIPKSNDDANLAFQLGELDASQNFLPQVWSLWEDKGQPAGTWFKEAPYHLPGNIPMAVLNIQRPGLDNVSVRRAIAHGINYAQVAELAMSRYSIPVNASLIVPGAAEDQFFNQEAVDATGWTYDPDKAVEILEGELGATKGDDGIYVLPDGTRLGPWKAICPYGWTDWMTSLELLSQGAQEIGIDISTEYPETPVFYDQIRSGDFDVAMMSYTAASAAGPWQRFRDVFDSRGVPPVGETAFWNYNRYQNDEAEALLDQLAVAEDDAKKDLFGQLDEIFRTDIPSIPLEYRPMEFFEYNEVQWEGFQNSENPHTPPTFTGSGVHMYSRITKKEG